MERKPKLHELLAVIPDVSNAANAIMTETMTTFSKKPDHFKGMTKQVTFFSETRSGENVSETKEIVTTVHEKLEYAFGIIGRQFDALLQQEEANQRAKADLIVDGKVMATDVPATWLLGMEKRLKALHDVMLTAPTLEPAIRWEHDATRGDNVFVSPPTATMKTEKILEYKILVPATDKHPAQVEKWTSDTNVARVDTTLYSGMSTPLEKSLMLARIDNLIAAVKKARQRANETEVADLHLAKTMLGYVIG